jgi:hypothetical protein
LIALTQSQIEIKKSLTMNPSSNLLHNIAASLTKDEPTTVVVVVLRGTDLTAYAAGTECDTAHQALAVGAAHEYLLRKITDGK